MSDSVLSVILENCNNAVEAFKIDDYRSGYIAMAVIMISFAPVAVILNSVTIYTFWKEKRTETTSDILLCFLTITDIIGGLLAMPFFAVESILHAMNIEGPCSLFLTRKLIGAFSVEITLVTSILIVFDRYCSIFYPFRYNMRKNHTGALILVVFSLWFVCVVMSSLTIITAKYVLTSAFTAITGTFFVFFSIWAHVRIFICARQTQREIALKISHFERNKVKTESWYRMKGARITGVMFCGIFVCYAPQIIAGSLVRGMNNSRLSKITFYWAAAILLFNSIVNPLIYIWQMKWFRVALRKVT